MNTTTNAPRYSCASTPADQLQAHLSADNSKMGKIYSWSVAPGNSLIYLAASNRFASDVVGTCGKHCDSCFGPDGKGYCYITRLVRAFPSLAAALADNTKIMREDIPRMVDTIAEGMQKGLKREDPFFRLHVSGELESVEQLNGYCAACDRVPDMPALIYTRATDILEQRETLPDNLKIRRSCDSWQDVEAARAAGYAVFVVDDGSDERIKSLPHCPAVGNKEVKCRRCNMCPRVDKYPLLAVDLH